MAHQESKMAARTDLYANVTHYLLSGKQSRFDMIKKDIGVLSSDHAPAGSTKADSSKYLAKEIEVEVDEFEEEEAEEAAGDPKPEFAFNPTITLFCQMRVTVCMTKRHAT
jgi:hypothetical protein